MSLVSGGALPDGRDYMKSTSIHTLDADKGLGRRLRRVWFLVNWLNNNLFSNLSDPSVTIRDFIADVSDENWSQTDTKSSPSRKLSDLFWLQLPWEMIRTEVGTINILDIGCGSGNYGVKLQSWSKDRVASYTGIDVLSHDNWTALAETHPRFCFRRVDGSDVSRYIPDEATLIISQSAIEHIRHDLLYFRVLREFARRTSRSIIQIHLFPSSACLRLYSFHGVRQYTPRTVSYITRLFRGFSYCRLYRLGGRECNQLHWEFITKPLTIDKIGDLRDTQTEEYDRRLRLAIAADNRKKHCDPSFYALVIHSNWRQVIFD